MCKCVPNMKFLCLTVCQGEVCIDGANINANDNAQWTIHDCIKTL